SQRRQGGRGRERHNRGRCPSPDYLGGLGRRASICHAMSRRQGTIASKQTLRTVNGPYFTARGQSTPPRDRRPPNPGDFARPRRRGDRVKRREFITLLGARRNVELQCLT